MKKKNSLTYYLLLIITIIALVNILSDRLFFRLDFTEDQRYTLSTATKNILKTLNEPVTVTAYYSENMPPDIEKTRRDFKEMLIEYSNISKGMLVYEFIDPNEDEESEMKAMQAGIQPLIISSREKDQSVQKKAYMGAIIQLGEETDIIPFIQPGAAMEYALSSSIKKLSIVNKPSVGFLQGHGEPSIGSFAQVYGFLSVLYNIQPVTLTDTTTALSNFNTIAIVSPTDSFPESHLQQLDRFIARGGRAFIACNRVTGDLNRSMGNPLTTGLETWLSDKGISIENNFVIDASCASVSVRQQQGMFTFSTNVSFPFLPVINTFEDHPITTGLEAIVLQFASSITFTGDTTVKYLPIAKTSTKSGTTPSPTYFDIRKQWSNSDFPLSELTVAATLQGKIVGEIESKLVVVSDGDFPVNGEGEQAMQLAPDNVSLLVNSIDWLSDDTGLIELRTKGVTSRPLDQIEDGTKTFLKYFNFLIPIIIIVIYGVFRSQYKRNLRIKRMEEGYV